MSKKGPLMDDPYFYKKLAPARAHLKWHWGILLRPGSLWIGAHWSPQNKRLCANFIPCVTIWVTMPGGNTP